MRRMKRKELQRQFFYNKRDMCSQIVITIVGAQRGALSEKWVF